MSMKRILLLALGAMACASNVRASDLDQFVAEIKTDQALAGTNAETVRHQHDAEMVKDMERRDQEIRADHAAYNEHLAKWAADNQNKFTAERLAKAKAAQAEIDARRQALHDTLVASQIDVNNAYTNYMTH
jgi:hypothetical protein